MYEFKTEPYEHQRVAFDKSWQRPAYALFMEMGTGKTKVAIDTHIERYPLHAANQALRDLKEGRLQGAAVLEMAGTAD
mgnify:CR=1 FL=1